MEAPDVTLAATDLSLDCLFAGAGVEATVMEGPGVKLTADLDRVCLFGGAIFTTTVSFSSASVAAAFPRPLVVRTFVVTLAGFTLDAVFLLLPVLPTSMTSSSASPASSPALLISGSATVLGAGVTPALLRVDLLDAAVVAVVLGLRERVVDEEVAATCLVDSDGAELSAPCLRVVRRVPAIAID
jgi:hypothetical protein